jgi:hypothetical protein
MHRDREPLRQPAVDVVGDVFGLIGADAVAERHPGGDHQLVRAHAHGAQVQQRVDTRRALDLVGDRRDLLRRSRTPDQVVPAVQPQPHRDHDEQGADRDRGRAVPHARPGHHPHDQAERRERQPDDGRGVLEHRGLHGGVGSLPQLPGNADPAGAARAADLPQGPRQRRALGDPAQDECRERDDHAGAGDGRAVPRQGQQSLEH